MKCCICNRERSETDCVVLTLTDEEKKFSSDMGQGAPDTLVYCKPCYKVLTDREQGARLMQGTFRMNAGDLPGAAQYAQRLYDRLIQKSGKKPS